MVYVVGRSDTGLWDNDTVREDIDQVAGMKKDFKVEFLQDYLRVTLNEDYQVEPGRRKELWSELRSACDENDTRRVLVEGVLPAGEYETSEVVEAGKSTSAVPHLWMAFYFPDFQPTEQTELYETFARLSGVRVKFFDDRERALAWLRANTPR